MKYAISYVSTASPSLNNRDIETVLHFSKNWNILHNVTGILLYSDGNFFQVLEGEKNMLLELFDRIKNDRRHFDVIKIFEKEINDEKFETYEINFLSLDSRYSERDLEIYVSQVESLNPAIQTSVKYILDKFSEGIK